ncbi:MAG: hypothetical protein HYR96_06695 [Deltaproteobacteria bacterium]|nr:hypothetical protein [Deltaproteobacteria bacterium]
MEVRVLPPAVFWLSPSGATKTPPGSPPLPSCLHCPLPHYLSAHPFPEKIGERHRVAAELERVGVHAQIVEGGRGIFDVIVDGKLIFSKHSTGHFPKDGEIATLLSLP